MISYKEYSEIPDLYVHWLREIVAQVLKNVQVVYIQYSDKVLNLWLMYFIWISEIEFYCLPIKINIFLKNIQSKRPVSICWSFFQKIGEVINKKKS